MARLRTKTAPSYTTPARRATVRTGVLGVARVRVDQDRPIRGPDDLGQDDLDPHTLLILPRPRLPTEMRVVASISLASPRMVRAMPPILSALASPRSFTPGRHPSRSTGSSARPRSCASVS